MSKVQIKNKSIQMSKEYFIDLLEQSNIRYSVNKNSIEFITPQEEFDQGVPVEIELEEKELFMLMNMAHEQNITLNKLVNKLLRELIEKEEKNENTKK